MKTISLRKTISKAILALACMFGVSASAQSTVTISRPGNSMYYEYNGSTWNHIHNSAFTYNSNGWLTSTINVDPVTNQNISKVEYRLDQYDRIAGMTPYTWQNNGWVPKGTGSMNRITTYNSSGKMTEEIWQYWRNGALENTRKLNYTFDTLMNLIEQTDAQWINNAWETQTRYSYTYANGLKTVELTEIYNNSNATWRPTKKINYSGWQIPNDKYTTAISQLPDNNGGWINSTRSTITLGQNGSYTDITESYQNGTWVNAMRETNSFDFQGNKTGNVVEDYINGNWHILFDSGLIYTYNAQFDMVQRLSQAQDTVSGPKLDKWKEVYSNFQYFTRTLGTSENSAAKIGVTVYPNPATDVLKITFTENALKLTATITDVTGKTWQAKTFRTEEAKQLNIEALPKGIYLLQLQTEKGTAVKRIVKQ